jgi:hypothetical protein
VNAPEFIEFPFQLDGSGRTALTDQHRHLLDMVRQLLFTDPGERVNRPEFGCGIRRLVFMPNSGALAAATQMLVRGSLQAFLGEDIVVEAVEISNNPPGLGPPDRDAILQITVQYSLPITGERSQATFGPSVLVVGRK